MEGYRNKPIDYFAHARKDLISLIPKIDNCKLLEIGASGGGTLLEIKRSGLASEVVGIDLMTLENSLQQHQELDNFIVGNIEEIEIPYAENYFDVIICGDVFEHLVDPWKLVKRLSFHLKPGGYLITSIPNIRIKSAMTKIYFEGNFGYTEDGVFDKTHLRFFCKKNMRELLTTDQLEIVSTRRNFDFTPGSKGSIFNKLTFNLFEEFLALQFLFLIKKKPIDEQYQE